MLNQHFLEPQIEEISAVHGKKEWLMDKVFLLRVSFPFLCVFKADNYWDIFLKPNEWLLRNAKYRHPQEDGTEKLIKAINCYPPVFSKTVILNV